MLQILSTDITVSWKKGSDGMEDKGKQIQISRQVQGQETGFAQRRKKQDTLGKDKPKSEETNEQIKPEQLTVPI